MWGLEVVEWDCEGEFVGEFVEGEDLRFVMGMSLRLCTYLIGMIGYDVVVRMC